MDPRNDLAQDGQSSPEPAPPLRRRLSMEEDLFYQHIMTAPPRRSSQPPPYELGSSRLDLDDNGNGNPYDSADDGGDDESSPNDDGQPKPKPDKKGKGKGKVKVKGKGKVKGRGKSNDQERRSSAQSHHRRKGSDCAVVDDDEEELPGYSSSITMEGIFSMKQEIENTIKRAEDRQWHTMAVALNGTALNVYTTKKDWGWGRSRGGPSVCPDNPPWIKKSKLEKSYSLLHADAGIAADYQKRRYVIRIRAEEDQFLLSCIELSTFVKWLECLFAAIDVAAPIDDRDFPRDMSIPRIQRIRWFRGQSPTRIPQTTPTPRDGDDGTDGLERTISRSPERRRSSVRPPEPQTPRRPVPMPTPAPELEARAESVSDIDSAGPSRIDPVHRLSTTSYPNAALDPYSGKWYPEHKWSDAHDMLYAKLCYSNLLFRSPRKSNYIISKGKQWFVDWGTGRMVRVLPPAYGENDFFGPWQIIHTENRRI